MFSNPQLQSQLARQRQADIRRAVEEARTARIVRLMRREARRERRAGVVEAAPGRIPVTVVPVPR